MDLGWGRAWNGFAGRARAAWKPFVEHRAARPRRRVRSGSRRLNCLWTEDKNKLISIELKNHTWYLCYGSLKHKLWTKTGIWSQYLFKLTFQFFSVSLNTCATFIKLPSNVIFLRQGNWSFSSHITAYNLNRFISRSIANILEKGKHTVFYYNTS